MKRATRKRKGKSLGQVARDAFWDNSPPATWDEVLLPAQEDWHRVAKAVLAASRGNK